MGKLGIRLLLRHLRLKPEDTERMEEELVGMFREWHQEQATLSKRSIDVSRPRDFKAECEVLGITELGPILEVRLRGEDDTSRGNRIRSFLEQQIAEHQPAGIVLDYLQCQHIYDSDLGGMIPAFIGNDLETRRPCAIIAKGRAAKSARDLISLTSVADAFTVQVFDTGEAGLAFVRLEIGEG